MHEDDRDLPEGVIDADPAGGWQDGATADGETRESSAAESEEFDEASVTDGWVADIPVSPDRAGADEVQSDAPTQVADPDMAADADTDDEEK